MAGAARAFEEVVADAGRLNDAADHIGRCIGPADTDAAAHEAAAQAVDALLLPLYSMAQERDIHAVIVGSALPEETAAFEHWAA